MKVGSIVQEAWEGYLAAMFGGMPISETQRDEMRKCFYAGATAIMAVNGRIGEPDISEKLGCQILDSIKHELLAFAESLPDNGPGGLTNNPWQSRQH